MDTTNVITADSLKQQKALTIPTFTPSNIDLNAISTPITTGIANDYTALQKQLDLANQQQTKGAQEQVDIMQVLTGRTADLQQAQEQAGVSTETANLNKYAEQLANLNAQASALNREAQAIPIQIEQESQGRGRTVAGVAPLEASRLRENALRALSIGQQADIAAAAATGSQLRLNAAKEKAQQVVDLKYKPLEEKLAIKKQTYELNKDILASIDKKRAESLNIAIKKEERDLEEKKANDKAVSDMVVNARTQGADPSLADRASKARTPSEAAAILGQYAGDYWGTKLKIAQLNKLNADAEETRAKVAAAGGVGSGKAVDKTTQAKFLLDTIAEANSLSGASGRSKARRGTEAYLVGATDYTNLESKVRTLKTNLLTLATDPEIKKFFGPQMTEADVRNMQAAATTLDTESQSPKDLQKELERAQAIFQKFAPEYKPSTPTTQSSVSWAESIKNVLLSPTQGGNYGYQDNTQQYAR